MLKKHATLDAVMLGNTFGAQFPSPRTIQIMKKTVRKHFGTGRLQFPLNTITPDITSLARALAKNKSLGLLNISSTKLNVESLVSLVEGFLTNTGIHTLQASGVEAGELQECWSNDESSPGEENASRFCCLEGNTTIKTLNVSNTRIASSSRRTAALNNSSTLETLYLKDCRISEEQS
jgi:hypothetical protein